MGRSKKFVTKKSTLTKKQKSEVRKIAHAAIDSQDEDKQFVYTAENQQLYHNKPFYAANFLSDIQQGTASGDQSNTGIGEQTIRDGDRIRLKNINIRLWLSNKKDRPNVIYKGVMFWYPIGLQPSDDRVYKTQSNKMLDRYNNKVIKIIDSFILKSTYNYSVCDPSLEKSYLATFNKSYKNKLITYDNNGKIPKGWEIGFAIATYDVYGTLQTDNIASFAYQSVLTFEDA